MLYGLDICAGSGIGSAAFEAIGFCRTVCYVERDAYCQRLLRQRMQDGWLAPAPIWDDLRTFDGRPWSGLVDLVFGGIPCQPHSLAGKRGGGADERDLWPDFWRVVREVGPRVAMLENVPGLLSSDGGRFMGRILGDLASGGYDAEWGVLSARGVGAPHRRERVWLVAYASGAGRQQDTGSAYGYEGPHEGWATPDVHEPAGDGEGLCAGYVADAVRDRQPATRDAQGHDKHPCQRRQQNLADAQVQPIRPGLCASEQTGQRRRRLGDGGGEGAVPDAFSPRLAQRQGLAGDAGAQQPTAERDGDGARPAGWWELEPDVDRVADGVAARVDRLRTIGNGWVPQVAAVVAARIGGF